MKKVIFVSIFTLGLFLLGSAAAFAQAKTIDGDWDAGMNTPGGVREFKLSFKTSGEKLSGTVKRSDGEIPLTGSVKGNDVSFSYTITYNGHDLQLSFTGKITGDRIAGSVSFAGQGEDEWSAKRAAPPKKGDK